MENFLCEDVIHITMIYMELLKENKVLSPADIGDSRELINQIVVIAKEFEEMFPEETWSVESDECALDYDMEIDKYAIKRLLELFSRYKYNMGENPGLALGSSQRDLPEDDCMIDQSHIVLPKKFYGLLVDTMLEAGVNTEQGHQVLGEALRIKKAMQDDEVSLSN